MARVNLEERVFGEARLGRLADLMGWDIQKALGALAFLWFESQDKLKVFCTAEEIILYARLKRKKDREGFIAALSHSEVGFIVENSEKLFEIRGNFSQIDNKLKNVDNSAKGGLATKQKWEAKRNQGVINPVEGRAAIPEAGRAACPDQAHSKPSQSKPFHSSGDAPRESEGYEERLAEIQARHDALYGRRNPAERRFSEIMSEALSVKSEEKLAVSGIIPETIISRTIAVEVLENCRDSDGNFQGVKSVSQTEKGAYVITSESDNR